jgi:hypothetical protein
VLGICTDLADLKIIYPKLYVLPANVDFHQLELFLTERLNRKIYVSISATTIEFLVKWIRYSAMQGVIKIRGNILSRKLRI